MIQLNIISIRANTLDLKFNVICLTEMQFTDLERVDSVSQNFKSYSLNRLNRRGGGTVVFILNSLKPEPMTELTVNSPHFETDFVKVTLPNKLLIISSIYRPKNTKFNDFRAYIENNKPSINRCEIDLVICGDF